MTTDPWKDLTAPVNAVSVNARRVDVRVPWDMFWARSADNRCLLIFRYAGVTSLSNRPPQLRGIEVTNVLEPAGEHYLLTLKLLDSSYRDLFFRLCMDIVGATATAGSERDAVEMALSRTWRWHHLLRGGGDERLSDEEQKGLIGELIVLQELMLESLSIRDAVSAWQGPLGAPKDFEIGRIAVEAKARRGGATPYVAISSEHQLDRAGTDALFLRVTELNHGTVDVPDAFSLTSLARSLQVLVAPDPLAADRFEALLLATGLNWEHDYSDSLWMRGADRCYQVTEGFPCITPSLYPSGVSLVRYSVFLKDCEPYAVPEKFVLRLLSGDIHAA